jgi:hypothetical protein
MFLKHHGISVLEEKAQKKGQNLELLRLYFAKENVYPFKLKLVN